MFFNPFSGLNLPLNMITLFSLLHWHSEYCQKYAKPEDVGAVPEENSSDEELSEDEYDSSDEAVAGPVDP